MTTQRKAAAIARVVREKAADVLSTSEEKTWKALASMAKVHMPGPETRKRVVEIVRGDL